jgi:cobalt-zinc-cadmium efflux system membrane fusion protein
MRKWVLIGVLAVAAVVVLVWQSNRPADVSERAEPEGEASQGEAHQENELEVPEDMVRDLRITTNVVEARSDAEHSTIVGELRVNENRYAEVAAPLSGRVSRLYANVGQTVGAGQPLAEIQSPDLGRARAALETASARLELARNVVERKRLLTSERIAPQREVQEAEADLSAAEAEVRAARAALQAMSATAAQPASAANAAQFVLRSPIAGTVLSRTVALGQGTSGSEALFTIANLGTLWLTVHAFERDAVRVDSGTPAEVTLAAFPGRQFNGTVDMVGRQVDPESRTVPIRIVLKNSGELRPGMSASARLAISASTQQVLTVPAAAVQRLGDEWVVFLPRDRGHFEIRRVGRGRDLGHEVEIVRGLQAGETIVVDGAFVLKAEAEKARGGGEEHGH